MGRSSSLAPAIALLAVLEPLSAAADVPRPEAVAGWNRYVAAVEARVERELSAGSPFLVVDTLGAAEARRAHDAVRRGEVYVHQLHAPAGVDADLPGALVHHWLGAILVPGATVDEVIAFVQQYDQHAKYYGDVMASRTLARDGDRFRIFLKLQRSRYGVTAHYNTEHDVVYRRHGNGRASSRSATTRIAELAEAGTPREREKTAEEDRDYLWRLNSYWRFAQVDGGVLVECESVSLSRNVPWVVRFIVGPFVRSVPKDSLERTLSDMRAGVAAQAKPRAAKR